MERLLQDLRFAFRTLLKKPGFTLVAVLSLGLGIGANATIFSYVNAVLLRPIPVDKPGELVAIYHTDGEIQGLFPTSFLNFKDYRERSKAFSGLAAYRWTPVALGREGQPERLNAEIVSGNFFDVLGVKAVRGRTFQPEEDKTPGSHPVVVVSNSLWKRRFAADPNLVGRSIILNGRKFTVIGIAPQNFTGLNLLRPAALWVPLMMNKEILSGEVGIVFEKRRTKILNLVARLKPGVTQQQAAAATLAVSKQLEQEFPRPNGGRLAVVTPLIESRINPNQYSRYVHAAELLMVVVGLVLLIACANVANLLLARAGTRRKEIAIRLAMGTRRARLIRQLLTESSLLSLLGGATGLLLSFWAARALWSLRPSFFPENLDLSPDARVLTFILGLCLLTVLVFGLVPAFQATRPNLVSALKDEVMPAGSGRSKFLLHNVFLTVQTALAVIALTGAGLFLRSLQRAQQIDPGFDSKHLMVMSFDLGILGYDRAHSENFVSRLIERVQAIPGVRSATVANHLRLAEGGSISSMIVPGQTTESGLEVRTNTVGLGYFDTLGIPLLDGRDFNAADLEPSPLGWVVVNEPLARRFWPGQSAVGQHFTLFNLPGQPFEVIGVARDGKYDSLGEAPRPYMYFLFGQVPDWNLTLHVRTQGNPANLLGTVRGAVQALDPSLPLVNVKTMSQVLDEALWAPRIAAVLVAVFGVLALVLALIGIYGISAYKVSQRRQEIGIRMALGAQREDVLGLILKQSMGAVLVGLVVGLLGALLSTRLIGSFLYGVGATDPVAFVVLPVLLAAISFVATLISARRATTVDPLQALRYQ